MAQTPQIKKKPKTGMSRLLELAATKKPLITIAVILSALSSIVSFIPYIAIYGIIRQVLAVYPDIGALHAGRAILYGWLAFAGVIGNILLYFAALVCSHLAAFGTLYQLKINFASHLARVPLGLHILLGSGKLRKIMDENIEKIEGFIAHQLPDLVAAVVAPFVMIIILLIVDWRMGLAAVVGMVVAYTIQMLGFGNDGARQMMRDYQRNLEDMNNASVEYIRGMSVVKAFKQTVYSFRRLRDTIQKYTSVVIPYALGWQNYMSSFTTIVNNIYLFVLPVAILIGINTTDYTQYATSVIFYLLFLPAAAGVLMKIMYVSEGGIQILAGVEAMDAILEKEELAQPVNPSLPQNYNVEFRDVVFSYEGAEDTTALNGVSFQAKQGEITAIVGPSGGGKSTIAHLIPRFFDATKGQILLGGVDIRQIPSRELMRQVSFVFQDVFLFKQSVKDNIRLGNLEATDDQVFAAAKAARCHEFIMQLPQGYDTVIGTKGVHLSGGEMQRLAIARAIVKDSPVIVLDEATAFADPENEHLIQKAFEVLMKDKTVIMIAHRLSTIRSADNIVVVDGGKVVEQGTHDTLVSKDSKYKSMWDVYMNTAKWTMTDSKKKGAVRHA